LVQNIAKIHVHDLKQKDLGKIHIKHIITAEDVSIGGIKNH
jgi:hypothetical protein